MNLNEIAPGRWIHYEDGDFTLSELLKVVDYLKEHQKKQYILTIKPDAPSNTRFDWILDAIEKMNNGVEIYRKSQYNKIDIVRATSQQIDGVYICFGGLIDFREATEQDYK